MRHVLWIPLLLSACASPTSGAEWGPMGPDGPEPPEGGPEDSDNDGLCDDTEADFATREDVADTDGDGFPDLVEVVMGFEATDPSVPDDSRVAFLTAEAGAVADFDVRVTVDGVGQAFSGTFLPAAPLYAVPHNAADFFQGALAVSGDPIDNVRDFTGESERFGAVFGPTRLRFALRFGYHLSSDDTMECVLAHPFNYLVKDESGEVVSQQEYLLVLVPPGRAGDAEAFCQPRSCL